MAAVIYYARGVQKTVGINAVVCTLYMYIVYMYVHVRCSVYMYMKHKALRTLAACTVIIETTRVARDDIHKIASQRARPGDK